MAAGEAQKQTGTEGAGDPGKAMEKPAVAAKGDAEKAPAEDKKAEDILVLEHARLIESGTHEDLIAIAGEYASLFELQAASYR